MDFGFTSVKAQGKNASGKVIAMCSVDGALLAADGELLGSVTGSIQSVPDGAIRVIDLVGTDRVPPSKIAAFRFELGACF